MALRRRSESLSQRPLAITLAVFALVYLICTFRYTPPAVAPASAPSDRFSGERAAEEQRRLVDDGSTRFVGTEGNARGRAVIAAELTKLGWTVESQREWSCTFHGACAFVTNVIGQLSGSAPGEHDAVLLSAHHDSVLAGPGASDDGLGTAALLETARALSAGPRPRRNVIALFADGEESGLLGAGAFLRHPLASTIGTTVNVDARGTHGPSQMFETSRGNQWLIALVGKHLERPVTTSLFYEVYKRMPNDTDFTLTKTIASGVNFANTAGIEHYHTPSDDLPSSDPRTLQHHGDHLLAMARAFAESTDLRRTPGDAVWFDVLAEFIVQWPEPWSVLLALLGLAGVLLRTVRERVWDRGLLVMLSLVPGLVATLAIGLLLRFCGALPAPFVAHPLPALAALHLAAIGAVVSTALFIARHATPRALWAGTWIGWGLMGVGSAVAAPGASYLFIVPTLAAASTSMLPLAIGCVVPAVVASVLVLALATGIYDALGLLIAPVVAVSSLLLATTITPMLAGLPRALNRGFPIAALAGAAIATAMAVLVPTFSVAFPQRVNVVFRQDDDRARVFVDTGWGRAAWGAAPASMTKAIGATPERAAAVPWTLPAAFADVARIDLAPPTVEVLSVDDDGGRHRVRARLRSVRGAPSMNLLLPTARHVDVKVEGHFAMPRASTGGSMLSIHAIPKEGVVIELSTSEPGPIAVTLFDRTVGVPPSTKAVAAVEARSSEATSFQDGDVTIVSRSASL